MSLRPFRITGVCLILAIGVFLAGCAHKKPVEQPLGMFLEDIYVTENRSQDVDKFKSAMPAYLEQYDKQITPVTDEKTIYKAAGAYFGYAYCFIEDTDKEKASELYLKGRNYAMSELKRYRLFEEGFNRAIPEFQQALREAFDKRNIQALYLTSVNWVGWINLNMDKPEARADIPKVIAMLEFINELDPSYANGAVHAALGSLYANRPKIDGGDPVSAKEQFELAFSYCGKTLMNIDVMYARFYATQIQNQGLFKLTLENVLATPADKYPDKAFVNEIARRKAQVLLDNMDKYFKPVEVKKPEGEEKKPEGEGKKVEPAEPPKEPATTPVPPEASPVPPVIVPQPPEASPQPAKTSGYQKTMYYPYTVHITSLKNQKNALSSYQKDFQKLDMAFITKIELEDKGVWYRIDYGSFASNKEAVKKMEELKSKGILREKTAFVGQAMPYTIELGAYGKGEAMKQTRMLQEKGQVPYIIKEPGGVYRVVIGAYPDEKTALPAYKELQSLNLPAKIVKR
jgi:hypothetical protein